MKLIGVIMIMAATANAQLPTVMATGGSDKPINWPQIQKEADADKEGPGFFYSDCSQGVGDPRASSSLPTQGTKNYSVKNLGDNDPMTAWVEGKQGLGIGEWFSVTAPSVNIIYNGYQATPAVWHNNSRVKKFKVYVDDVEVCYLVLKDKMGGQQFELPFDTDAKEHVFKFEIVEAYKGLKWEDVAISHVDFMGCCLAGETILDGVDSFTRIDQAIVGETILTVNVDSLKFSPVEIKKISAAAHQVLFKIRTAGGEIQVTGDHPLYTRSGFSSINALKKRYNLHDYSGMISKVELLRWNGKKGKFEYESIKSVEVVSGMHNTYSVRALTKGFTYLANGFVTKTY